MFEPITADEIQQGYASLGGPAYEIIASASRKTGMPVSVIPSKTRETNGAAHIRQDCMACIRHELGYSFPRIGRIFKRDHTTVSYGVQQSEKRRSEKSVWAQAL